MADGCGKDQVFSHCMAFQAEGFKGISASNIWLKFKDVLSGAPLEASGWYCVKLLSAGGFVEFHGS